MVFIKSKHKSVNEEILEAVREIRKYKRACEANIVSILWKDPELFYTYDNLESDDFTYNEWEVYWKIGKEIVTTEGKPVLDDITVGLYLKKHPELKEKYDEYGGFNKIDKAKEYVEIDNMDGYYKELGKWNAVLRLIKKRFPVHDRIKDFVNMTGEEIYEEYEALLNHTFINVDSEVKSYSLYEGLHELIDECNEGEELGFPIDSPMLNKELGGNMLGNITLLGAQSGAGKTTTTIQLLLPNMVKLEEKVVMVINEQDQNKLKRQMITWVANNIFKGNVNERRFREGHFTEEEMNLFRKSANWLEERDNNNVIIIPLQTYTVEQMIKIINKYSALGVKYFILDTFKESDGADGEAWKSMMTDMRRLYDVVKPASKDVHLWVTTQLVKSKIPTKYLTTDAIGMSKNIVDVCSVVLLMRRARQDEKDGGKNELQVYRLEGKHGKSKVPVKLHTDKNYLIIFIDKNREGESQSYQIVAEVDYGLKTYKEVGVTFIAEDF